MEGGRERLGKERKRRRRERFGYLSEERGGERERSFRWREEWRERPLREARRVEKVLK